MEEIGQHQALDQELLSDAERLRSFDIVCYVYDTSDANSFGYVANLRQRYEALTQMPSIFVAAKSDLDRVSQRYDVQPDVYCRQLSLPAPISVSARDGMLADLFQTIVAAAMNPAVALPANYVDKYRRPIVKGALIVGASMIVLIAALTAIRLAKK